MFLQKLFLRKMKLNLVVDEVGQFLRQKFVNVHRIRYLTS